MVRFGNWRTRAIRLAQWTARILPLVICLILAFHVWAIFFPGLLSFDSVDQYDQARTGRYTDWHSPLLAITLAGVFRCGGDIQHVILGQVLAGVLGVYFLATQAVRSLVPRLNPTAASWLGLAVVLILHGPPSILPIFLVTFWKDIWLMILFCWIGAVGLPLIRDRSCGVRKAILPRWAALLLLSSAAALVRHNAVVLLPIFCFLSGWITWPFFRWRYVVAGILAPAVVYAAADQTIRRAFDVQPTHSERCLIGFELIGLCARNPQAIESLPFTRQYLLPEFRARYRPGFMDLSLARGGYTDDVTPLRNDYWIAMRKYPADLFAVKAANFRYLFVPNECVIFQPMSHKGEMRGRYYDFPLKPKYAAQRETRYQSVKRAFADPIDQWIIGRHLTWLSVNLIGLLGLIGWWLFSRRPGILPYALLLTIPLTYCFSFLLANVSGDYRYLYPSTLVMQTATLALLMSCPAAIVRRFVSRRDGPAGNDLQHPVDMPRLHTQQ